MSASGPVPETIRRWHEVVERRDASLLDDLLAEDVVFRSPAVHKPQEGKAVTTAYLTAAMAVLGPTLRYVKEWYAEDSGVLQFEARLGELTVHGVDIIRWGADGRIVDFTVMARPWRGLERLIELMGQQLAG